MTTINTNAPLFSTAPAAARLPRFVTRFLEARAERAQRRETFQALRYLTERELADIGLTRGDVNDLR